MLPPRGLAIRLPTPLSSFSLLALNGAGERPGVMHPLLEQAPLQTIRDDDRRSCSAHLHTRPALTARATRCGLPLLVSTRREIHSLLREMLANCVSFGFTNCVVSTLLSCARARKPRECVPAPSVRPFVAAAKGLIASHCAARQSIRTTQNGHQASQCPS